MTRETFKTILKDVFTLWTKLSFVVLLISVLWVIFYRFVPIPGTVLMTVRMTQDVDIRYEWRDLDDISPQLIRAVISAEDQKFCHHAGFDLGQIKKAVEEARQGRRIRGASTISQQTAKNVFLWPGKDPLRKGIEVWFTSLEEFIWPKRRIMEVYLNIAEWGDGTFGAEAASQHYFQKPAKDLTAAEASYLAAVLPNPNVWRAVQPGPYVSDRAAKIRVNMAEIRRSKRDSCIYP